jgi:hypothetical protein
MSDLLFAPIIHARWSTVLLAAVALVMVTIRRRDVRPAIAVVMAWASTFELFWNTFKNVLVDHNTGQWQDFLYLAAFAAAWVLVLSYAGIGPSLPWLGIFVILATLWALDGFHFNFDGQAGPVDIVSEVLNEGSKTALGIAFLAGALRRSPGRVDSGRVGFRQPEGVTGSRPS